jgi:hypothetical protein
MFSVYAKLAAPNSVRWREKLWGSWKKCPVQHAEQEKDRFFPMNTVNVYHRFIKERNRNTHGFATKYLNRCNALFSKVYRTTKEVTDDMYTMRCDMNHRFNTASQSQTQNLLEM